jgi:ADP-heptose:LPS heptosyltransferase
MTVSFARAIDRIVGTPLCWMLNHVTRGVGLILRRRHEPPYQPKRILVIKLMGIGSIVQALPLLGGLAERFPEAEIRMLCFPETRVFARRIRSIAHVFTIDNRSLWRLAGTTVAAMAQILKWRPDLVLDLEMHSKFSSLLTTFTAAQNRGGLFDVTTAFRNYLHTHLVYANPRQHISDLYSHLGRVFGVQSFRPLLGCAAMVRIDATEEQEAAAFVHQRSPHAPLVLINPNAGALCLERRWPPEKFAALAAKMTQSGTVILVGSAEERPHVESVRDLIPDETIRATVVNAAGALSFGAYLALLKRATLVVTNDTGPMHLAALLGAPVVSLWGPGVPATYEPRTPKHIAVSAYVFRSPCLYITHEPPCGGNNICMKQLSVGLVLDTARQLVPEIFADADVIVDAARSLASAPVDQQLPGLVSRP